MPLKGRRGFTLAEIAVALALGGLVLLGAGRLLLIQKRLYHELGQRTDLSDNLRAAADILAGDLWSLDASDGDILALGSDSIRIRAEREFAVVCAGTAVTLVLKAEQMFGVRDFQAGDSILVRGSTDSAWGTGLVRSSPRHAACPDSSAGSVVDVDLGGRAVPPGTPIRGFEILTYRSYQASDGSYYLGVRDAGGLQPLAGPLVPGSGLRMAFVDSSGKAATNPRSVSAIRIRIRAQSAEPVTRRGVTALLSDSVVVWVTLRNNR